MITIGTHFTNPTIASDVLEIVPANVNLHGVTIRTCIAAGGGSTVFSQLAVFADTTPPTDACDPDHRVIALFVVSPTLAQAFTLPYELHIPAGLGIWVATVGTMSVNLTYDILSE